MPAAAAGEHQRAARLFGAAHPLWQSSGALRAGGPTFAGPHGRYEAQVRQVLGEAAFATAFQHGTDLTADQAVTYALGNKPAAPPSAAPAVPAALTRQDCQVAELVAKGSSNKDIASASSSLRCVGVI